MFCFAVTLISMGLSLSIKYLSESVPTFSEKILYGLKTRDENFVPLNFVGEKDTMDESCCLGT